MDICQLRHFTVFSHDCSWLSQSCLPFAVVATEYLERQRVWWDVCHLLPPLYTYMECELCPSPRTLEKGGEYTGSPREDLQGELEPAC